MNDSTELDKILFKNDRLYCHNLMQIRYTTYDVCRKQDTVNPRTPHCDIMVLANNEDEPDHPFLYARIIGIFHANVIYTGTVDGVVNYCPHQLHFLWV